MVKASKTNNLILTSLFLALFFIASNLIPAILIFGIPFTFQTLIILLIPFYFNLKQIIIWYLCLTIMCLIGIPMMSGFKSGIQVFINPSSGFIYGWLVQMIFISCLKDRFNNMLFILLIISSLIGLYCGTLSLSYYNNINVFTNYISLIIVFLPFEIIKILMVLQLNKRLTKIYN